MKKCVVIAGGPSVTKEVIDQVKALDMPKIVVNKAILSFPNADCFITMDYSFLNKCDIKQFKGTKIFVANLHPEYMVKYKDTYKDVRLNKIYDLKGFDKIIESKKKTGFSKDPKDFRNGYHSGHCGIQLAISLGYTEIFLVGFDFTCEGKETHFHGGYGEGVGAFSPKLKDYFITTYNALIIFRKNNPGTNFYSCSKISRLNKILPMGIGDKR